MSSRINREKLRLTPDELEGVNNFSEVADAQLDKAIRLLSDCEAPVLSDDETIEVFYCEHKRKCRWQCFALHQGYGIGKLENTLSAWREAHEKYCGGKLIKGFIVSQATIDKGEKMKFNPEKDNPCWGCEYRKSSKLDCINVCLLDDELECVRGE